MVAVLAASALPLAGLARTVREGGINEEKKNAHRQKAAPQSNRVTRRRAAPAADHHTHIWSADASEVVTEPLLPAVELPEGLARLLRGKERWGGKEKNPAALAELYTKDALVLNPAAPAWLRGERALNYVLRSTEINRLLPTAYEVDGSVGYVAGYEVAGRGASTEYVSNFFYALRRGPDGEWRIAAETFTVAGPAVARALTAGQLVEDLDAAGIGRGVVLSVAYWFGSRLKRGVPDEYAKVRAENDWAAGQVARFPDRLVAFCSFNPLKEYALAELDRCAGSRRFKGLKLHFGMSEVDLTNPEHVRKVRQVFAAANRHRLPIIVHVHYRAHARAHAEALLNRLLPAAPDVPVQVAHLWGGEAFSEPALAVYAEALAARRPATRHLYFDLAEVELILKNQDEAARRRVAALMRRIGLRRFLWASDGPRYGDAPSREAWAAFRAVMPLREDEFGTIAGNVAPYLR